MTLPTPYIQVQPTHPCLENPSPLQLHQTTSEPVLRIPGTHFMLTPTRSSDAPHRQRLMSHPTIDRWLYSPPKPYELSHSVERDSQLQAEQRDILDKWRAATDGVSGVPIAAIRFVDPDNPNDEGLYAGEVNVHREDAFDWIPNEEERERAMKQNLDRDHGDPEIVWTWGFMLDPARTGKGAMTSTLRHLLLNFLVPVVGVQKFVSYVFVGNEASVAVHRKLGFEQDPELHELRMPPHRGGALVQEYILRWCSDV